MFNLYRKGLKMEVLRQKADEYAEQGLITVDKARQVCKSIEEERGHQTIVNEQAASEAPADAEAAAEGNVSSRLSAAALKKELELREKNMQAGATVADRPSAALDGPGLCRHWYLGRSLVQLCF